MIIDVASLDWVKWGHRGMRDLREGPCWAIGIIGLQQELRVL